MSVFGPLDGGAAILVNENGALASRPVRINNASLASVAVGPPRNDSLMSFRNRPFHDIARKLLGLRPLGLQLVHPSDDVFRGLSRARRSGRFVVGEPGLDVTYAELISRAFRAEYWDSSERVDG